MNRWREKLLAVALCASAVVACNGANATDGQGGEGADDPVVQQGQKLYTELCASCHGTEGEGRSAPRLRDWKKSRDELVDTIDKRMPLGSPEACDRNCAESVAAYILAKLKGEVTCDQSDLPPRRLRLLTRREYEATVRDLLGFSPPPGASAAATCGTVTFRFDAQGRSPKSVHVAGSFNNWPQTIGGGGWPLTKDASGTTWSLTKALPDGKHTYKFVVDERDWLTDQANPAREGDGQGGQNSVLNVGPCSGGGGGGATPGLPISTAGFPTDTRPDGFPFDNSGNARLVTSVHAEEYLKAARGLAANVTQDVARLLSCKGGEAEQACASRWVRSFGQKAFRRPLTDAEAGRYEATIKAAGTMKDGLTGAVAAFLMSPNFLYRTELGEPQKDGTFKLTSFEVASALSYTLWGTMPDDALLDAATNGELAKPEGIEKHARRLLADGRARQALGTFATQWLGIESVNTLTKNDGVYPAFSPEIRAAMIRETRAFFEHVLFEGSHQLDELFLANYTFADEKLAKLYGLAPPKGGFGKVALDDKRSGILGHGSILATTAHSDQSSPIRRGLFVRRTLLCQQFGQPPANAGGIPKVDPKATTKERFRQHTENPACASCHQYIDELGFGFERFDGVGQYRLEENGQPIDGVGDMNDVEALGTGTHAPFKSLPELGKILASSEAAKACFVETVRRFTFGDPEISGELCAKQRLVKTFDAKNRDMRELFVDVLLSPEFVVRR